MKRVSLFFFVIVFVTLSGVEMSFSQSIPAKKEYIAVRISSPPKIDGILDDSCWINVAVATDFVQTEPNPGLSSNVKTEVKLVYDNSAIYISAMMYDPHPDSILCEMSKHDNVFFGPNADAFGLLIDAYQDGQNGVFLGVTTCNVQTDTKVADPEEFDDSWNVAWESKVKITDKGWIAEMRIPYSILRFPKKDVQEWAINFSRQMRRWQEFSNWNPINPNEQGFIHQSGILKGISNIESPLRLSISPYVSSAFSNYDGSNSFAINGGADVKYGINESFTMDMTLIPDFGQVRSDDKVLNLSPFETYYDEQRSFFMEGTEMFNRADVFYSRRIGGEPLSFWNAYGELDSNEVMEQNPLSSQLYNATKISGRTKEKLGIGFLNATTGNTYAVIFDTISDEERKFLTNPLTNYNVFVLDQALKNNSFVSLINTNVTRDGGGWYDANVTGAQFKIADKKNKWAVKGSGAMSQLFLPDSSSVQLGHYFKISAGKISGNYGNSIIYQQFSDTYDCNDLGYIERNNSQGIFFHQWYNVYKPFWVINKMTNGLGLNYFTLYSPRTFTRFNIGWETDIDFKNYYTWGVGWSYHPVNGYDYYEPRVEGRYFVTPKFLGINTYFSSDSRKDLFLSGNIGKGFFSEEGKSGLEYSIGPRYRFNDRFNMNYSYYTARPKNDAGFVVIVNDTIIFGIRDRNDIVNTLQANYIFTSTMSLSLRARHYWSQVKYNSYFALTENGTRAETTYEENNDINFNAVTVDMIYTWQFAPASELSFVWKNAIFTEGQQLINNYLNNINKTFESPQLNSFSVKILYYLDYQNLKRKK